MDPSQSHCSPDGTSILSTHAQSGSHPEQHPHNDRETYQSPYTDTIALSDGLSRLSLAAAVATPLPVSPSSASLLSPPDVLVPAARPVGAGHLSTPRRTPSSSSLRDERRKSTPSLRKRSSVNSLRSVSNTSSVHNTYSVHSTSPRPSLSRRSSSNLLSSSPTNTTTTTTTITTMPTSKSSLQAAVSLTADYFKQELHLHESSDLQSEALVVLQDDCYGHRFSRPFEETAHSRKSFKRVLERPERLRACALGVSAAYVRLGRRYAEGRFAPYPSRDTRQRQAPPFRIRSTRRLLSLDDPVVKFAHGDKLVADLKGMCHAAASNLAQGQLEIVWPDSAGQDDSAAKMPELLPGDMYLCAGSLSAFEGALGGVCDGIDAVFDDSSTKRAFVCIRPPGHHCSPGHPSGFCWVNNVHVGISYAYHKYGLTHAAIIDFDLHHGDGSQELAWERNLKALGDKANHATPRIGYYSMHDINNFPCAGGDMAKVCSASVCLDNVHGQSIWNVHLESWNKNNPAEFWKLYETKYTVLIQKARSFLRLHAERLANTPNAPPKAAIFISAGFDASEHEGDIQENGVTLPTEFYARFTAEVVRMANEEGLHVDGRVISVLEGGYDDRALTSGVMSHLAGLYDPFGVRERDVQKNEPQSEQKSDTLRMPVAPSLGGAHDIDMETGFNPEWWSPSALDELEKLTKVPRARSSKSQKAGPNYCAPTQSFSAKVVTPPKDRKSLGSQEPESPFLFPAVDWATATHELWKLLIPADRETMSHRPQDLEAEYNRIKRDRQQASDSAVVAGRMQLRERKPKPTLPSSPEVETPKKKSPNPGGGRHKSTTPVSEAGNAGQGRRGSMGRVAKASTRPSTSPVGRSRKTSSSRPSTPKRSNSPKNLGSMPPVPDVPPAFTNASTTAAPIPGESTTPHYPGEPSSVSRQEVNRRGVDSLSAGVKKLSIKLRVPSPEENAARERRAAEERKRAMDS